MNFKNMAISIFFVILSICAISVTMEIHKFNNAMITKSNINLERQGQIFEKAENVKEILTDMSFIFAAALFNEEDMITDKDMKQIMMESLKNISARSERTANLMESYIQYVNTH